MPAASSARTHNAAAPDKTCKATFRLLLLEHTRQLLHCCRWSIQNNFWAPASAARAHNTAVTNGDFWAPAASAARAHNTAVPDKTCNATFRLLLLEHTDDFCAAADGAFCTAANGADSHDTFWAPAAALPKT